MKNLSIPQHVSGCDRSPICEREPRKKRERQKHRITLDFSRAQKHKCPHKPGPDMMTFGHCNSSKSHIPTHTPSEACGADRTKSMPWPREDLNQRLAQVCLLLMSFGLPKRNQKGIDYCLLFSDPLFITGLAPRRVARFFTLPRSVQSITSDQAARNDVLLLQLLLDKAS